MLLGAKLFVYTDHRNLTHKISQLTTQRVLRWQLLLEEYGPTFPYLPGPQNVIADALSRVPTTLVHFLVNKPTAQSPRPPPVPGPSSTSHIDSYSSLLSSPDMASHLMTYLPLAEGLLAMPERVAQDSEAVESEAPTKSNTPLLNDSEAVLHDTHLFYPRLDAQGRQPFHFPTLHHYQQQGKSFLSQVRSTSFRFFSQSLGGYDIVCYRELPDTNSPWRIAIPDALLDPLVNWYHLATNHLKGMDRLESTIARNFYHPNLRQAVRRHVAACPICPKVRTMHQPYGQLALHNAPISPWSEVHVDSIGPWTIQFRNGVAIYHDPTMDSSRTKPSASNTIQLSFDALTCIDPVTNLLEIYRYPGNKTASEAARLFENHWLSRYPRPNRCVHDNGPEFVGHDFQFMLSYAGIAPVTISPITPTSNSIIEAIHKAIGQSLRTTIHLKPLTTALEAQHLIEEAISIAMHACRCASNSSLGNYSPGSLVFQRDMFLDIPLITDLLTHTRHRQATINNRLLRANRHRLQHEFKVGQQVYVRTICKHKLQLTYTGPYPILQVHTNNTVTIQRGPIHERISIRHLKPCLHPPTPAPDPAIKS